MSCSMSEFICWIYFTLSVLMSLTLEYSLVSARTDCQPPIKDYLHFTKNITDLDNVQARQYVRLDCCASGFDTITWYFRNKNTNYSWIEFPFLYQLCDINEECPTLSPRNQTLHILKATTSYDNGTYLCVALNTSTGENISHMEDLIVYDCVDRDAPESIPPSDIITNVGQNATFHCAADYGCKSRYLRDVLWYIGEQEVNDVSKRYIVTTDNREFNPVVQANLTILNVQESDFDVIFSCWIASDYDIETPKFHVRLRQEVIHVTKIKLILIIVVPCVFIILLVKVVQTAYGPHISYYYRSKGYFGGLPKMGINHHFHALVVHDDSRHEDNCIAEEITTTLERRGYNISNQIGGAGVGVFAHFGGSLEQSAAVIVIDMERDSEDSNKFRVFIESSLRNFSDSLVGFTIIQRKEIVNSVMDSVEYKGLKRLTWPGQHCTDRQKQKFYKQLQLRLPKPHCPSHEGVINGERTSLLAH
uniref:Soluble interferon alpha/beta receptor OPG204 n=1 Tax=Crassostrea virginica TaxID=6565 RepID=A0A8B8AE19_CRAVI|nr:uncharacterized protein LOC111101267 [Crassostrea virginica]